MANSSYLYSTDEALTFAAPSSLKLDGDVKTTALPSSHLERSPYVLSTLIVIRCLLTIGYPGLVYSPRTLIIHSQIQHPLTFIPLSSQLGGDAPSYNSLYDRGPSNGPLLLEYVVCYYEQSPPIETLS